MPSKPWQIALPGNPSVDDFQSRRPIDVISANRPIMFLDEPQKMEGGKTLETLANFKPLAVLRYSATHKTTHNKIHRLDALDAYNQKLVKKIAVRGISVKGLTGTNAYLYLESIEVSKSAPVARVELETRQNNGIKRVVRRLSATTTCSTCRATWSSTGVLCCPTSMRSPTR